MEIQIFRQIAVNDGLFTALLVSFVKLIVVVGGAGPGVPVPGASSSLSGWSGSSLWGPATRPLTPAGNHSHTGKLFLTSRANEAHETLIFIQRI